MKISIDTTLCQIEDVEEGTLLINLKRSHYKFYKLCDKILKQSDLDKLCERDISVNLSKKGERALLEEIERLNK